MKTYPLAGKSVLEHCYMDDLLPSAPNVDVAKEMVTKQESTFGSGYETKLM